jgi:hypothetical protein
MIVYKVVKTFLDGEDNRAYCSASLYTPLRFKLSYKIGEQTVPTTGKLMAFNTIRNARKFMVGCDPTAFTILKCQTDKVEKAERIVFCMGGTVDEGNIIEYWEYRGGAMNDGKLVWAPDGTVLCDWLLPLLEVK